MVLRAVIILGKAAEPECCSRHLFTKAGFPKSRIPNFFQLHIVFRKALRVAVQETTMEQQICKCKDTC